MRADGWALIRLVSCSLPKDPIFLFFLSVRDRCIAESAGRSSSGGGGGKTLGWFLQGVRVFFEAPLFLSCLIDACLIILYNNV